MRRPFALALSLALAAAAIGYFAARRHEIPPPPEEAAGPALEAPPPAAEAAPPPPPEPLRPAFDVVRARPGNPPVMAGRAAPGATVVVRDGGVEIGRVAADRRGEWVFVGPAPLAPGAHELTLQMQGADGAWVDGSGPVVVVMPFPGDDREPSVAFRVGPQGAELLQPAAGDGALSIDTATQLATEGIFVAGRGPVGARLQVTLGEVVLDTPLVDAHGRWRAAARLSVRPGRHLLRAEQISADGRVAAAVEVGLDAGLAVAVPIERPGQPVAVRATDGWRVEHGGPDGGTTVIYRRDEAR